MDAEHVEAVVEVLTELPGFHRALQVPVGGGDDAHVGVKGGGSPNPDELANVRIIQAACERLGVPPERAAVVLHRTGNTSSASIPLALVDAIDSGRVKEGDLVLLVGFGAGMTAASALLRWGGA